MRGVVNFSLGPFCFARTRACVVNSRIAPARTRASCSSGFHCKFAKSLARVRVASVVIVVFFASARTRASYFVRQITSARTRARLKKKFNPFARTRASCFRLQNGPQYSSLIRVRATNSQLSIWLARVRARLAMLHFFLFALPVSPSNLLAFVPLRSQNERFWPGNAGICREHKHLSHACEKGGFIA